MADSDVSLNVIKPEPVRIKSKLVIIHSEGNGEKKIKTKNKIHRFYCFENYIGSNNLEL